MTEGTGIPIAVLVTGANRHDMKQLAALLDATVIAPALVDDAHVVLDRGDDYPCCLAAAIARGYTPHIPPNASAATPLPAPGEPNRHPPRRWVVEVAHSWFNRFRRRLTRWKKRADCYLGFVQLVACLIIYRKLRHARSLSG